MSDYFYGRNIISERQSFITKMNGGKKEEVNEHLEDLKKLIEDECFSLGGDEKHAEIAFQLVSLAIGTEKEKADALKSITDYIKTQRAEIKSLREGREKFINKVHHWLWRANARTKRKGSDEK